MCLCKHKNLKSPLLIINNKCEVHNHVPFCNFGFNSQTGFMQTFKSLQKIYFKGTCLITNKKKLFTSIDYLYSCRL